jgi:hypothetical protein
MAGLSNFENFGVPARSRGRQNLRYLLTVPISTARTKPRPRLESHPNLKTSGLLELAYSRLESKFEFSISKPTFVKASARQAILTIKITK